VGIRRSECERRSDAGSRLSPGSRPEPVREVVGAPLRHLRTGRADLLYQQGVDPAVPMEKVARPVSELVARGKVRQFYSRTFTMEILCRKIGAIHFRRLIG
jgi:aryl-alcohol dehydrogenase-like predicted oxidoreductase